ncbi:MAG: hypothetical protein Q7S12_02915 [bacterium]|nr:hypothetical protein [bacterium]
MDNNCVFCDRSQFEERLCGETKDFWIIATLGQITDGGYVLLVPKRHVECIGAMEMAKINLLEKLVAQISDALLKEYGAPSTTLFEHGIVGQTIKHAHLHIVPAKLDITHRIFADFPRNAVFFQAYLSQFCDAWKKIQMPYLLWKDSVVGGFKASLSPEAPLQYLRTVVAETIGRPERANWRTMDPELDKKLWSETVRKLKPYFKS